MPLVGMRPPVSGQSNRCPSDSIRGWAQSGLPQKLQRGRVLLMITPCGRHAWTTKACPPSTQKRPLGRLPRIAQREVTALGKGVMGGWLAREATIAMGLLPAFAPEPPRATVFAVGHAVISRPVFLRAFDLIEPGQQMTVFTVEDCRRTSRFPERRRRSARSGT
jgi:hypothetical protein